MQKNVLWTMILILLITNALTFALWKKQPAVSEQVSGTVDTVEVQPEDPVAIVAEKTITQADLLNRLESVYGNQMLREMVNREVINEVAKKHNITVTENEVEQELNMLKSDFLGGYDKSSLHNENEMKDELTYLILLEKILTKDVVIPDTDLEQYYRDNKTLFKIPTMFHLSQIVVSTEEEANDIIGELENGSSFFVLAMERSEDTTSAVNGGNLGYLSEHDDSYSQLYYEQAGKMEPNSWGTPIPLENKFVILYLHEKIKGRQYTYDEVKNQIHRQLAMQQTNASYSVEPFWSEVGVEWLYSEG